MTEPVDHERRRFLGAAAIVLAAARLGSFSIVRRGVGSMHSRIGNPVGSADEALVSLGRATAWFNSGPLTAAGLRGRVVVVDFWTYTCINWMRSLPYVRAWNERYGRHGLTVIGVHTPEFGFEHDLDNVRRAVTDLRVGYPVAVDNDMAIWRAFDNNYWPALYFIDAEGRLRGHAYGEGDYDASERTIQRLLSESGISGIAGDDPVNVDARGAEAAADLNSLESPETYLGYERGDRFASPGGAVLDRQHGYAVPATLRRNQWALAGEWTIRREAAETSRAHGRVAYRFHARDLHLVMGPSAPGRAVSFRVSLEGQPPGAAHGADIDSDGTGTVTEPRMYQLIRQPGRIADRQFEIEFLDAGAMVFAFTFG